MPAIGELSTMSRYKRTEDDPHSFHSKENETQQFQWVYKNTLVGVYVRINAARNIDPCEEVTELTEHNTWKGRLKQSPTEEVALNQLYSASWTEHRALVESLKRFFNASEVDYQVLLATMVADGQIIRESRPSGRKMSYHYRKK